MDDVPDHFLTKIEDFKGRTRVSVFKRKFERAQGFEIIKISIGSLIRDSKIQWNSEISLVVQLNL